MWSVKYRQFRLVYGELVFDSHLTVETYPTWSAAFMRKLRIRRYYLKLRQRHHQRKPTDNIPYWCETEIRYGRD